MATVDITAKKPDLVIDTIKCRKGVNHITRTQVSSLKKNKKGIYFNDGYDKNVYINDLDHANHIKKAIDAAIALGWFDKKEGK